MLDNRNLTKLAYILHLYFCIIFVSDAYSCECKWILVNFLKNIQAAVTETHVYYLRTKNMHAFAVPAVAEKHVDKAHRTECYSRTSLVHCSGNSDWLKRV